ncbi:MAG: FMN-binding glutamate synthase family protein [Clostridia bacterium]|nr:FMN-binding glutamate synthase family protein [Clostridia bacterium]
MSYSPTLSSGFTAGRNSNRFISPPSGMCSFCSEDCNGTCEIALAAVLGARTVYPITTGNNQIASEKDYPLDYSHFNINGRVFGAEGTDKGLEELTVFDVKLNTEYGSKNKIQMNLPIILPALIKLNWRDYFGGAAMSGVSCVIGEDARNNDPNLVMNNGKITEFPLLQEIMDSYYPYHRGFGQLILQCNADDNFVGVPEIAIKKYGYKAIEIKFGQGAKGVQPLKRLKNLEMAIEKQAMGCLVHPDPSDPKIKEAYENGACPSFYSCGRFPVWTEENIKIHIEDLREMGAENIYFKMAGYDEADLERVLRMACANEIDMVTFDGAGGGSGYSPSKMMNEWSYPTIMLEQKVVQICKQIKKEGLLLPAITITGGFASEDQVFKALALGEGYITSVGLCRAAMAAAMTGQKIGAQIKEGKIPPIFQAFGKTVEEIYSDLPDLCAIYGKQALDFSTGAIGVFSYLHKIGFGVQHFGALNRKFDVSLFHTEDLIPLTLEAEKLMPLK